MFGRTRIGFPQKDIRMTLILILLFLKNICIFCNKLVLRVYNSFLIHPNGNHLENASGKHGGHRYRSRTIGNHKVYFNDRDLPVRPRRTRRLRNEQQQQQQQELMVDRDSYGKYY